MTIGILTASYITSSVLFILALGGLSNQEKAKRAVWYGIFGMAIAVAATIFGNQVFLTQWLDWLIGAIVIGSAIGVIVAKKSSNDRHATACCCTSLICRVSSCIHWD
jgi:NAD(P) transhydrogenase subunit beta